MDPIVEIVEQARAPSDVLDSGVDPRRGQKRLAVCTTRDTLIRQIKEDFNQRQIQFRSMPHLSIHPVTLDSPASKGNSTNKKKVRPCARDRFQGR